MHLLVDAQRPPALARFLESNGHEAKHVMDIGLRDSDDTSIWDCDLANDAVIVTKDEDFAHRLNQGEKSTPVIVWLRIGNTSRRALREWVGGLLAEIEKCIARGERLIEAR